VIEHGLLSNGTKVDVIGTDNHGRPKTWSGTIVAHSKGPYPYEGGINCLYYIALDDGNRATWLSRSLLIPLSPLDLLARALP
jgi:hypothetical protein